MSMSSYKDLLLRFGAIDMLPNNPFYILGLPCNATPRQIRRRKEDLEAAHEMGESNWRLTFPYLLKGSSIPSYEEVQEAFCKIEDINVRIISAFFWFWMPVHDHERKIRHAYERFLIGDIAGAEKEWILLSETSRLDGRGICGTMLLRAPREVAEAYFDRQNQHVYAKHNLGVLNRLKAMIQDNALLHSGDNVFAVGCEALKSTWVSALSYERRSDPKPQDLYVTSSRGDIPSRPTQDVRAMRFVSYDNAEDVFTSRWAVFISQDFIKTDPRITDDLLAAIEPVVRDLPVMWQSMYVIEYAKSDDDENVKRHADLLSVQIGLKYLSEDVLICLFGNIINRHMALIRHFDEIVKTKPEEGLNAANGLFDATSKDYDAIHALLHGDLLESKLQAAKTKGNQILVNFLEMHKRFHESVYDPVVKAYLRYMIKYSEATKDWQITIEWEKFLSKLAVSEKLKKKIDEDLLSIFKVQANDLSIKYATIVSKNAKKGAWAVRQILIESRQLISSIDARYGADSEISVEIKSQIGGSCRNLLVEYGNATKDWSACIQLLNAARIFAMKQDVLTKFDSDIKVLTENQAAKEEANRCWCCRRHGKLAYIEIAMHGNVIRDYISKHVTWQVKTISIPICFACKMKYYGTYVIVLPFVAGLCSSIGLLFGVSFEGYDCSACAGVGAIVGLGLALLIYWCNLIKWLWFRRHPQIISARENCFYFGRKPSGVGDEW